MSLDCAASRWLQLGRGVAVARCCFISVAFAALAFAAAGSHAQTPALSLLVFGDSGASPDDSDGTQGQLEVARAMMASDAAAPADAIVMLGDLFYPDGLLEREQLARIEANLVRPYCRFLAFDGPEAVRVEPACGTPASERRPLPIFATLGNHDHEAPESPALIRALGRRFFGNWRMPAGMVEAYELRGGVSLVVVDSTQIYTGADAQPVAEALRASRGPWRILAAHHPIADRGRLAEAAEHARYRAALVAAIEAADVVVHLMLAGHEHNLQVLTMDAPAPALHVISGGGSGARSLRDSDPNRKEGFEEAGFVRVDLVDSGGPERARLEVSLFGLPRLLAFSDEPRRLTRWTIDRVGNVAAQ
jgi:hypothetical protein